MERSFGSSEELHTAFHFAAFLVDSAVNLHLADRLGNRHREAVLSLLIQKRHDRRGGCEIRLRFASPVRRKIAVEIDHRRPAGLNIDLRDVPQKSDLRRRKFPFRFQMQVHKLKTRLKLGFRMCKIPRGSELSGYRNLSDGCLNVHDMNPCFVSSITVNYSRKTLVQAEFCAIYRIFVPSVQNNGANPRADPTESPRRSTRSAGPARRTTAANSHPDSACSHRAGSRGGMKYP